MAMNVLAYLGPETMLPMTSILAGALGFIMMFGRKAVELTLTVLGKKPKAVAPPTRARGHRPASSRNVDLAGRRAGAEATDADSAA